MKSDFLNQNSQENRSILCIITTTFVNVLIANLTNPRNLLTVHYNISLNIKLQKQYTSFKSS